MMEFSEIKVRLRKVVPVCSKKDPICLNNIYLSPHKQVTFGRVLSDEVHVRLLSKTTPLMISRKHATIGPSYNNEGKDCFIITDHNSINGIYINSKRIKSSTPHSLHSGDIITFGCGVGSHPAEFEYAFETINTKTKKRTDNLNINVTPTKKKCVMDSPSITIIESNAIQIKDQEEKISLLSEELLTKENMQKELQSRLEQTEIGLIEKLEKQQQSLEESRKEAELELKNMLENQLFEKEKKIRNEYDEQIKKLQNEKIKVEVKLQEELSYRLSEKHQLFQQELQEQKLFLEQAMIDKENELNAQLKAKEGVIEQYKSVEENQKELETCLLELRKEIQDKESQLKNHSEVVKKVETEAKQNVIQTMEDEFTCIVCQELFIEATTLPCAHTFCELCLRLWMKKKKNCPVCRRSIKGKAVRSVVLDNAVEKMLEAMDDASKQRRSELKNERLIQKRKEDTTEDPTNVRSLIHRPEDDDDDGENNNAEGESSRGTSRQRERRRSRSRSPRHYHHRHRPYEINRYHENNGQQSSSSYPNGSRQIFQTNQTFSRSQYYHGGNDRNNYHQSSNVTYYHPQVTNQYTRCFNCGGIDHIARFCPRR